MENLAPGLSIVRLGIRARVSDRRGVLESGDSCWSSPTWVMVQPFERRVSDLYSGERSEIGGSKWGTSASTTAPGVTISCRRRSPPRRSNWVTSTTRHLSLHGAGRNHSGLDRRLVNAPIRSPPTTDAGDSPDLITRRLCLPIDSTNPASSLSQSLLRLDERHHHRNVGGAESTYGRF